MEEAEMVIVLHKEIEKMTQLYFLTPLLPTRT